VIALTEVEGMESDVITLQDLFTFDYGAGRDDSGRFVGHLRSTGLRPKFTEHLHDLGIELPQNMFVRGSG
jgi:pilus assembly protein CpaF